MGGGKSSMPQQVAPPPPKEVIITGNEAKSRTKYPDPATTAAMADDEGSNVQSKSSLRSEKKSTGLNIG
jgi:hypothetical protein